MRGKNTTRSICEVIENKHEHIENNCRITKYFQCNAWHFYLLFWALKLSFDVCQMIAMRFPGDIEK